MSWKKKACDYAKLEHVYDGESFMKELPLIIGMPLVAKKEFLVANGLI